MSVPAWVQDAIFYQIFPDRFYNGDHTNDPVNVQPWGAEPTIRGYQGGDLRGVLLKFDYLLELGVNAIYFNPIFKSSSNHRYHTVDYFQIDPLLGTMHDFKALLDVAHQNNVKVIVDGVFNHCARGFHAFNDLLENGQASPYVDWFHVNKFPIDAYSPGEAHDYRAWWGIKDCPKFNTNNPQVRQLIMDVARYWIEQGIDGWRLDVPGEIDDDAFWAEFRRVVKSVNPDAYLVGEIWTADPRWVGDNHFDGLMNYPLRDAMLDLIWMDNNVEEFANRVEGLLHIYPRENVHAMYLTLGSHDTERIFTMAQGNVAKTKLLFFYMFSYPGAPVIYYGDEIGIEGGKDPHCRQAFPWDESQWNTDLRGYVRRLTAVRKSTAALRRGDYHRL
ncbi:MAG: glycoside hydrolase family 13 protein, partial [Anaerolineales bacterium]|nr:glycoside hydrolase family 13 protein [Anaerolineales bacterium]